MQPLTLEPHASFLVSAVARRVSSSNHTLYYYLLTTSKGNAINITKERVGRVLNGTRSPLILLTETPNIAVSLTKFGSVVR